MIDRTYFRAQYVKLLLIVLSDSTNNRCLKIHFYAKH